MCGPSARSDASNRADEELKESNILQKRGAECVPDVIGGEEMENFRVCGRGAEARKEDAGFQATIATITASKPSNRRQ